MRQKEEKKGRRKELMMAHLGFPDNNSALFTLLTRVLQRKSFFNLLLYKFNFLEIFLHIAIIIWIIC